MQRHHISKAGLQAVRGAAEQDFIKADGDATGMKIASHQTSDDGEKRHKQDRGQGERHGQRHLTPLRNGCGGFNRSLNLARWRRWRAYRSTFAGLRDDSNAHIRRQQ